METLDSITAKTEATETLAFLEKDQSIQIHVSIPKKFIVRNIESADEVYRKILALSPDIDTLAKHAFINYFLLRILTP